MRPGKRIPSASGVLFALLAVATTGCGGTLSPCPGESPAVQAQKARDSGQLAPAPGAAAQHYDAVRTRIDTRPKFHNAAVAFRAYPASYPFYLLGFEKPRGNSARPYCAPGERDCAAPVFDPDRFQDRSGASDAAVRRTRDDIRDRLYGDPRTMVLTHVLRAGGDAARAGCFIFNVYGEAASAAWCEHRHTTTVGTRDWTRAGWQGLARLADDLRDLAAHYRPTHVIVLATGWNTDEYESYLDFQQWMTQLAADYSEARVTFRPVFVGISWESAWVSPFWSWLPFGSWTTKGNDADEIGFTWANVLLNDVLRPLAQGAQLVAIGHSFGSRIVLGAHYARDIRVRTETPDAGPPPTLIGLQAAFPTGRFIAAHGREHPYLAANKGSAVVVITTSRHDQATGTISVGTGYVGGPAGLRELRDDAGSYAGIIALLGTGPDGQPLTAPSPQAVSVYDASAFVCCQLDGTKSGAHSDVYDREMGRFLGEIMRATAGRP